MKRDRCRSLSHLVSITRTLRPPLPRPLVLNRGLIPAYLSLR